MKLWKVMIQVRKWPQTYHEYADNFATNLKYLELCRFVRLLR